MENSIIVLPEMKVVSFDAYSPDAEIKAFNKMKDWIKEFNLENLPYRIFGYNIDSHGNLTYSPQHAGYIVLLHIDYSSVDSTQMKTEVFEPGKFLVIETEGEMDNVGEWLGEGWNKVNETIQNKKLKMKSSPRWFEEHIKTKRPNYLKVDLYIEIE